MRMSFFPFPSRLHQRWWHRLAKVVVALGTIVGTLIGILIAWMAVESSLMERKIYRYNDPGVYESVIAYSYFPEMLWLLLGPLTYIILVGLYAIILYVAYGNNPFKSH